MGRHITFRYEGVLPLADQDLLVLLDILVNKADLIEVSSNLKAHTRNSADMFLPGVSNESS